MKNKEVFPHETKQRDVFVLVGLAGAGKSTVADLIQQHHDEAVNTYEMSDFVREEYRSAHGDFNPSNDNELGSWAAQIKDVEGQDTFARGLAEDIKSPQTPHVVISGVRSPEEATAIEDVFEDSNVTTVAVWTMPDIRFERKYGDKPHTDHEQWRTFTERNERELWNWGAVEFFSTDSMHEADYIIPNHDGFDALEASVQQFLNGRGQYDTNPFPHSDFEKVAQYL